MYLTKEKLNEVGACERGVQFFDKHFPNGVELIDIIKMRHLPKYYLYWGYDTFELTANELNAYEEVLNIRDSEMVVCSHDVNHGSVVSHSEEVRDSKWVFYSEGIEDSECIHNSQNVDTSQGIFQSALVSGSTNILTSTNVLDSIDVAHSSNISYSQSVLFSKIITKSEMIFDCENMIDSIMCSGCKNLKNSMFCYNISDAENMIFNKPTDPTHIENLFKQFDKIGYHKTNLVEAYDKESYVTFTPKVNLTPSAQFANAPKKFRNWIRTIPNYDPWILTQITLEYNF